MVAGRDDDLRPLGQRSADRLEHGLRGAERLAERAVTQLQDVAKQHEPVDVAEVRAQRVERLRTAEDVHGPARAEVQVADDEGAHAGAQRNLPPHARRST